jgi:hypothetical protein
MTLEQIKIEIADLMHEQQDHLAAFLAQLRYNRDTNADQETANRLSDLDPLNWISLSKLKEKWKD